MYNKIMDRANKIPFDLGELQSQRNAQEAEQEEAQRLGAFTTPLEANLFCLDNYRVDVAEEVFGPDVA